MPLDLVDQVGQDPRLDLGAGAAAGDGAEQARADAAVGVDHQVEVMWSQ